jgi:class 3 adenylate cyclase/ketosteroid isomerase-like protein
MEPSVELRDICLGMLHDWASGNPDAQLDRLSTHPNTLLIATDPDEWWRGGDYIRTIHSAQTTNIGDVQWQVHEVEAWEEGDIGWAACRADMTLANGKVLPHRSTVVFRRENGSWKIVQSHVSLGVPNVESFEIYLPTSIDAIAEAVTRERPDMTAATSEAGTVTMMFTDIESSTELNERVGDARWLPVLDRHDEIVRRLVQAHGGTVVKAQGDGFLLAFPSARRATGCAISIQRAMVPLSIDDAPVRVRIGIHVGEPVRRRGDFYGRDVAFAARVGAVAAGGEILVSALLKSLIDPTGSFVLGPARVVPLKGFGDEPVFVVDWGA